MSQANKNLSKGCLAIAGRSILTYVLSFVVVGILGAVSIFFGMIVGSLTEAIWGIVAALGMFFLLGVGGGWAFIIGAVLRRKMLLDKAFTPLGLNGSMFRLMFRKYEGSFQGRNTEVFFQRGPNLEIMMPTNLQTRAGFTLDYADTKFAADLFGNDPVPHAVAGMDDVRIYSDDPDWARNLLADSDAGALVKRMLEDNAFFVRSHVKFIPGFLHLQNYGNTNLFRWSVTPELAKEWTGSLAALADRAERNIPRPGHDMERTKSEEFALTLKRKDTTRFTLFVVFGLLAFFAVMAVFVAIFVAVLANLG
ncbi:MAG: hypothetical protein DWQ47_04330 [Acidobacteria bacterium]|nr:MAG: hypothetical protein DWQ32_07880 [Acidobacteriota bacterium]REK01619.1 MAG: hypothetical protein DWQ38_04315 [Acidobacteriota bacterium]REK14575.1 MAG: hypothetical protein DWQ43_13570 [Acidobacteriota bacterium]REK45290.1 MAG: hypothetical protein DWQ47_04330 [Acidobacteriota bacterium]